MSKKDEIINLKKNYLEIKKEIDEFGEEQFKDTLELIKWTKELIENAERIKKQEEKPNPDLKQKFKLGKKMQRAYKEDYSFEATIMAAIEEGKISFLIGEKFKEIALLLKKRKIDELKVKFKYFEKILDLEQQDIKLKQKIEYEKSALETKNNKAKYFLNELKNLDKINLKNIELVEKYLEILTGLNNSRRKYIQEILKLKIKDIIMKIKEKSLINLNFPKIEEEELNKLQELFEKDNFFKNMKIQDLYRYLDYSDQKLSYIYLEISKFNNLIRKNRVWFDQILNLEKTKFLTWKDNEILNLELKKFFESIGEKETISHIEKYEKELPNFKEKFEEYEKYMSKKQELQEIKQQDLEKEIKEYEELLLCFDLNEEESQKSDGFLNKLKTFFNL
ncbi:MAG: hypothetical protein WC356_04505 [Candidatus Micrarchaeia archaeon]|jgi:hypothetical protein